ncbi:tigger transposable element-derived protein 4-like [Engystomops pustulosus]|uniref:tigger transposable element-derived protein 4-like n=1 Tax=Engystomops pustulosus TaxID=76066 RepID=UPI003AFAE484
MTVPGTRRKLCILTLRDRISVIKENEAGRSQRDLAKEFNCSKTQIQATLAKKEYYLRQWQENVNENSKRRRWQPYEEVNTALLEWLYRARSEHFPITGPMLQEKALHIASQLGLHRFHASNGWLNKFRTRHNIRLHPMSGASVEMRDEDGAAWKDWLQGVTGGYADCDIYNVEATGLFYKAIPDATLPVRSAQCKGGIWAEQRLTVVLCANLCGHKEEPLVIHAGSGCAHRTEVLGIWQHGHRKAWMTPEIYRSWIERLNEKMRLQERRILLFVDAPSHCAENTSHVEVKLLPPCDTSWSPPMQEGVIRAFKVHYRKILLRSLLARMDDTCTAHALAEDITAADAVTWVRRAWDEVKPETITRGFLQSGFVPSVDIGHDDDEDIARALAILNQLGTAAGVSIDFENIDENLECLNSAEDSREEEDPQSDPEAKDPETSLPAEEPIDMRDALASIRRHKLLAAQLGRPLLMDSLLQVEAEYEDLIVAKKLHPV